MATRNLTKKFIEIRNSSKSNRGTGQDEDHDGGLLKTGDTARWKAIKQTLPPQWVDQIEKVDDVMAKIQSKTGELDALHRKRLKVNFETDESEQERDIERKTSEVTALFGNADSLLKQFKAQTDKVDSGEKENQVRKNMHMAMAKKLHGLSMNFRNTQKRYMNSLQNQKSGGGAANLKFLDESAHKGISDYTDGGFNPEQMSILENMEVDIDKRDEEIMKIAKSIEELAQIFKELAVLVIDQGTILDRIDYNMEQAVEQVKGGMEELKQADEHSKSTLALKCIILLVLLIAIMIGILVWKNQNK